MKKHTILFPIATMALLLNAQHGFTQKNIGLLLPPPSLYSTAHDIIKNSMYLAIQDINSSGGLLGNRIDAIALCPGNFTEVYQSTIELVNSMKVVALFGGLDHALTNLVIDVCDDQKVCFITPTSEYFSDSTKVSPFSFHLCYDNNIENAASAISKFTSNENGEKNIVIVSTKNKSGIEATRPLNPFHNRSWTISYATYDKDSLSLPSVSTPNSKQTIILNLTSNSIELNKIKGHNNTNQNVTIVQYYYDSPSTPNSAGIEHRIESRLQRSLNDVERALCLRSYTAVIIWGKAVTLCGSFDPLQVSNEIRSNAFNTPIGPIQFTKYGGCPYCAGKYKACSEECPPKCRGHCTKKNDKLCCDIE